MVLFAIAQLSCLSSIQCFHTADCLKPALLILDVFSLFGNPAHADVNPEKKASWTKTDVVNKQ